MSSHLYSSFFSSERKEEPLLKAIKGLFKANKPSLPQSNTHAIGAPNIQAIGAPSPERNPSWSSSPLSALTPSTSLAYLYLTLFAIMLGAYTFSHLVTKYIESKAKQAQLQSAWSSFNSAGSNHTGIHSIPSETSSQAASN